MAKFPMISDTPTPLCPLCGERMPNFFDLICRCRQLRGSFERRYVPGMTGVFTNERPPTAPPAPRPRPEAMREWTCEVCKQGNPKGTFKCCHCGCTKS